MLVCVCVCVGGGRGVLNTLRSSFKSRKDEIIFHHVRAVWFNWAHSCEEENCEGNTWTQLRLSANEHANCGALTHAHTSTHTNTCLTLLMRLSLMCRSCCCASCMCKRFWRTSPLPSIALCKSKGKTDVIIIIIIFKKNKGVILY